jgi:broad-specificity NMP kinase
LRSYLCGFLQITEDIFNDVPEPLADLDFEVIKITLICSEEALKERILKDVKLNLRDESSINMCVERLELYENMNTIKIDTTNLSIAETVDEIIRIVGTEVSK